MDSTKLNIKGEQFARLDFKYTELRHHRKMHMFRDYLNKQNIKLLNNKFSEFKKYMNNNKSIVTFLSLIKFKL